MRSTLYIGSTSLGFRFLIPRDSYPFTLFLTSSSKFSLLRHRFPQRCLTPQCGSSLRNKVKRHMHRGLALHSRASFNRTWTPFGVVQSCCYAILGYFLVFWVLSDYRNWLPCCFVQCLRVVALAIPRSSLEGPSWIFIGLTNAPGLLYMLGLTTVFFRSARFTIWA